MNKLLFVSVFLLGIIIFSCQKESADDGIPVSADTILHEDPSDYIWNEDSIEHILLKGSYAETEAKGVIINGNNIIINKAGDYQLDGELNGSVTVAADTSDIVRIFLCGVSINNSIGPAIYIENAKKVIILLPGQCDNILSDGSIYSGGDPEANACLFSKVNLTIYGPEGLLTIKGNYQDGITSKDGLILKNASLKVNAKDDGIRGKDYLVIKDGLTSVIAGSNGLLADDASSVYTGYILINGGEHDITSTGDGISANSSIIADGGIIEINSGGGSDHPPSTDISGKGVKGLYKVELSFDECKINSSDDAIHSNGSIQIRSGSYHISTSDDAIHADNNIVADSGYIFIDKSIEGFEAKTITINEAIVNITSRDDSFNATAGASTEENDGSFVYFNGGVTILRSKEGDALDSNGSIQVNNGLIVIHGPEVPVEVAIDYNGEFKIDGGTLIATSMENNKTPGINSKQPSVVFRFNSVQNSNTLIHIEDSNGNQLLTLDPENKFQSLIFSTPLLVSGERYSIFNGGSSTGVNNDGFIVGGSYTPGTHLYDFNINDIITLINL